MIAELVESLFDRIGPDLKAGGAVPGMREFAYGWRSGKDSEMIEMIASDIRRAFPDRKEMSWRVRPEVLSGKTTKDEPFYRFPDERKRGKPTFDITKVYFRLVPKIP